MYCTKCGTQHNSNFCPNCGTPASGGTSTTSNDASTQGSYSPKPPKPKKPIYKRVWFWLLAVLLFFIIVGSLGNRKNNEAPASPSVEPTLSEVQADVTATPTTIPASTPTPTLKPVATSALESTPEPSLEPSTTVLKMPGIKGSQAYDVILSLEQNGVAEPDTQTISNGFYWQSSITDVGVQFMYDITANEDHEIACATFTVFEEDTVGVLAYCASLPYDAADSDAAMAFVNAHLGEDAQTTIGDAIFTLTQLKDGTGTMLDISVVGYDDYVMQLIGG